MVEPSDRPAASSFHGDREPEVSVRTVRLEELLAILRRHVRLVVGVAVPAAAGPVSFPVSLQIAFGRDSFVVRGTSGQWSAPYGSAVESHGIRFAVLHRPDASTARLRVLSREAAITRLLARLRVKPRLNTDIVDVTYSAPDPYVAQHVLNQVVDIFKSASAEDAQQQSR